MRQFGSRKVTNEISHHIFKWKKEIYISVKVQEMRRKEYLNYGDKWEPKIVYCNHQEDEG